MRVLTVYYAHRPGGMMQMLYRMLLGGAEAGWEMHYVSVEPYRISHPHLHWHRLPWRGGRTSLLFWAWFFFAAPIAAIVLALRHRIDLFAVFEGSYAWAVLPATRLLRRPLLVFLQSDVATINRLHGRPALVRRVEQLMEGIGLRAADRVVATNQALADIVRARWRLPAHATTVLPNNVRLPAVRTEWARRALRASRDLAADAFLIATSGVFSPRKNLALLLEAFSRLDANRAHLIVVGEGPDAASWHRTVEAARTGRNGDRIHFLGWRDDVAQVLGGCDLFVFPSRHEGSPLSLIEALRLGLPCLGSNVAEIREVLGDNPEALFDPDDVDGLRARVQGAIDAPDAYERLHRHSAERARRYDFDWEARVTAIMQAVTTGAEGAPRA